MERTHTPDTAGQTTRRDDGFTLVELLIVIVILGILATVTVFAVRGITDKGQENACATEQKTYETAAAAYFADHNAFPASLSNLSPGYVKTDTSTGVWSLSGENVVPVSGGKCDTTAATPGTPTTYAGQPARAYGSGAMTVLMIGDPTDISTARTEFNAVVAGGTAPTARLLWVDTTAYSTPSDFQQLDTGITSIVYYFDTQGDGGSVFSALPSSLFPRVVMPGETVGLLQDAGYLP